MFDGLGTELNSIIDNLCSKFGVTVEALLPELCKFKVFECIGYLAAFGIIALFILICLGIIYYLQKKEYCPEELAFTGYFSFTAILSGLVIAIAYTVYKLIIWVNSPTGAAVNYIIQQLKHHVN